MEYDKEIAEDVLDLIADGYSLERIERLDFITRKEFLRWRRADAELSSKYEKAIQDRVAFAFDKLSDAAMAMLDPNDTEYRGRIAYVDQATKILTKMMGQASTIVLGYTGGENSKVPHITIEFVDSNEEAPPEAL